MLLLAVVVIAAAAAADRVHALVYSVIGAARGVIAEHAILGAIVFVILSALSAMVVFFSTAVITPIAIEAYGSFVTLLLLWAGWILGGVCAYAIGSWFGPPVVRWFINAEQLQAYSQRASKLASFGHVLLFQLSVPSEIPGYVLGLAGCHFRTFVAAITIAELPFAIGAVYLGESFLHQRYALILGIGVAGIALTWLAFRKAVTLWHSREPDGPARMPGVLKDEKRGDGGADQSKVLVHAEGEHHA